MLMMKNTVLVGAENNEIRHTVTVTTFLVLNCQG